MSKIYKEYCWHCLDKDKKPLEIEVKKTKELTKEMKELVKESKEKYGNEYMIKKALFHACPKCGKNVILHPAGYLNFYYPPKEVKEEIKDAAEQITEEIKEELIDNMPETKAE